jgi:hypothetical protein
MRIRKIGDWEEHGPRGNHEHGYYIECVDLAFEERCRYAQVGFFAIPDADIMRLARGETVDLEIDTSELQERIT